MIFMDWEVFSEHGTLYWGGKEEDLCSNLSAMRRIPRRWALKRQDSLSKEQPRQVNPTLLKTNKQGNNFCSVGGEWLTLAQRSCGMPVLEDTENSTDQGPQQPALKLKLPLLWAGIGPDDLLKSLQPELFFNSMILWKSSPVVSTVV